MTEADFDTLNHLFKPAAELPFFHLSKEKGQATVALAMKISCFASCQQSWHLFNPMPNALSTELCWKKKHVNMMPNLTRNLSWPIRLGNRSEFMAARNNLFEAIQRFALDWISKIGNFLERGLHSYHTFVDFGEKIGLWILKLLIEFEEAAFIIFDQHYYCLFVHSHLLTLNDQNSDFLEKTQNYSMDEHWQISSLDY